MRGIFILKKSLKNVFDMPIALGQVIETAQNDNSKMVKVMKMHLSKAVMMYFNKSIELKCLDENNISKNGDIVIIQRFLKPKKPFENYFVKSIFYKAGNTVDPFTKEKINSTTLKA